MNSSIILSILNLPFYTSAYKDVFFSTFDKNMLYLSSNLFVFINYNIPNLKFLSFEITFFFYFIS